jgi:hypothetical protein
MASERRRRDGARSWLQAAVMMGVLSATMPAAADPTPVDRESARALMDDGDASYDAHNYEAALQAYDAANAIMKVPTTGYAVAKTLAALGRLVEARDAAVLVTHMPSKPNETRPFVQARTAAEALSNELQAAIASLLITVDGVPTEAVQVEVDGIPMAAALLGHARKTDPGPHVVHASATGYSEDRREVTLARGQSASVALNLRKLPAAEPTPPSAALIPPPLPPAPLSPPQRQSEPSAASSRGTRTLGLVLAGSGVVLVGVGGLLALHARSNYAGASCDPDGCDREGYDTQTRARSLGVATTVMMSVGAAALATGAVVFLLAPSSSPNTRFAVSPRGAFLEGNF